MSRRTRSVALIVLLALLLSAAVLLWQLPSLVRWAVVRQLEATTGRRASIERLDLSLLRGRLAISGLRVADKGSGPPLAEIDRLDVAFRPAALVRAQLHAREATIAGLRVNVVRSEQGALSIADLLNRPPSTGPPAAVTIDKLWVTGGVVTIEDRAVATPRAWRAESLAIEGSRLSTIEPGATGALRVTASVAGAPLAVDVTAIDLASGQGSAHITAKHVDATVAQIAAPPDAPLVLARAGLTVDLVAGVDGTGAVSLYGGGTLDDVAINRRGSEQPAATSPSLPFSIQGAGTGGVGLGFHHVEVSGSALLIDPRSNPPASVPVERLQLSLAPKTADAMGDWLVLFTAMRKGGGQLDVEGTARPSPLGASLRVRVTRIDLGVWDSLIPLPGRLGGFAEADLTLTVSEGPVARAQGRATLTRLSVHDGDRQLLGAEQFDVIGIDAQWPRVKIDRLRLARPTVAAERDSEGRLSLMALVPPAGPPSPRAAAAPGPSLQVEIGELVMSDGTATIDDQKVSPAVRMRVSPFGLTARGLTWPSTSPAKVELKAALPIAGTLEATGTATIEPVTVDLRLKLTAVAIGLYQPYLPIAARIRGRLDADLAAKGALEPKVALTMQGTAGVRDLAIGERDKPVITVARIDMTGLDYTWPTTVALDRLRVERSWALLERRADGAIPLMSLFRPLAPGTAVTGGDQVERVPAPRPPGSAAPTPPPPPAFDVTVRESVLEGGAVTIADATASPPVRAEIAGVRLAARDFTWPTRRAVPIDLRVPMPGGGAVTAQVQIAAGAKSVDGKVAATSVDLAPFAGYAPIRARVGGKASADLTVTVALDPFNVTARGVAGVADVSVADGNRALVTAARADVTGLDYAWPATAKIDRVEVQRPAVVLERRADGALPIRDLLLPRGTARPGAGAAPSPGAPDATAATPAAPLRVDVAVREAVITGGSAAVTDASVNPAARFDLGDLRVTARDVTWPVRGPMPVQVSAAVPGGGTARAEGQVAADASGGTMKVTLRDADLSIARPYLPIKGVVAGKASADLDVTAALEPFNVTARGTASVADLSVSDAQRPLVKASRVEVTGLAYAWPAKLSVDRVRAAGSSVLLERAADGTLGMMSLLEPPRSPATRPAPRGGPPPPASPPIAPEVDVRLVTFEDAAVTVVDASLRPPTRVEVSGARLSARGLTWPARTPATIQLRAPMPGGGSVDVSGQVKLDASGVDLTLALATADIAAAAPYLPVRARVNGWADGRIAVKGSLSPLAVAVTGSVTIWDALLADGPRPLATAKQVDVNGIDIDWPKRVAIEKLAFRLPWLLAERGPDHSIPLLDAILPPESPAPASAAATPPAAATPSSAAPAAPLSIQIGSATVEEGFVRFVDASVRPSFVEEASRIMSSAQRLSSAANASSPIAVKGNLSGNASFEFTGSVGPVMGPLGLDVKGKVTNLALTHLNPYLNLYLGWVARRGVVSMTVDYRIKDDQLDAKQDVVIGQPEFAPSRSGGPVRDKLGVPLDTLTSLLKDSRGEVKITAPVTGTVSSRQFDFGDAVWAGVRKTVINVLALPVSWVGKVFYTEDARIDTIQIWPIAFDPGTTQIRRDLAPQAERLAGFLKDAPGVSLLLKSVATSADVQAMAKSQIRAQIDQLARQSSEPPAAAAAKLWAEKFRDRPAPEGLDAIVEALATAEPPAQSAIAALAKSRVEALKKELGARGVDVARLRESEGAVPVEASGDGRVEFEIVS